MKGQNINNEHYDIAGASAAKFTAARMAVATGVSAGGLCNSGPGRLHCGCRLLFATGTSS